MKHTEAYVNGFTVEAGLREKNVVLDLVAYDQLRRENSAVRYCFGLFGYILDLDLPDEIFEHPVFMRMHLAAVDMVTWSNVWLFPILIPLIQHILKLMLIGRLFLQHGAGHGTPYEQRPYCPSEGARFELTAGCGSRRSSFQAPS